MMIRGISGPTYIALLVVQWVMLTIAHATVITHASHPLERYVTPHISDGWIIVSGIIAGLLLGITARSIPVLLALAFGLCGASATIYGFVIYAPSMMEIIARATVFMNYATQQAIVVGLWSIMPVLGGAFIGHIIGGSVRRAAFPDPDAVGTTPWWETRGPGTQDPSAGSGQARGGGTSGS